ncbi:MAG: SseB family protein [Verrucomicrobia bacterium]|nr:SseB family protein [Verrucomicrobiota bacterium]
MEKKQLNEFETAFCKALAEPDTQPAFFRLLMQQSLFFLQPDKPGLAGSEVTPKAGEKIPFVAFTAPQGQFIPLFTSHQRVEELFKKAPFKEKFCVCEMKGRWLFFELGTRGMDVMINPASDLGELPLPQELVGRISDGRAMLPPEPPEDK